MTINEKDAALGRLVREAAELRKSVALQRAELDRARRCLEKMVRLLGTTTEPRAMSSALLMEAHQLGGREIGGVCALASQYAEAVEELRVMEQRLKEYGA